VCPDAGKYGVFDDSPPRSLCFKAFGTGSDKTPSIFFSILLDVTSKPGEVSDFKVIFLAIPFHCFLPRVRNANGYGTMAWAATKDQHSGKPDK
jgi:hypothetical protein